MYGGNMLGRGAWVLYGGNLLGEGVCWEEVRASCVGSGRVGLVRRECKAGV